MRIRSTKPEFWRSHRIASVSWDARLVLKGLESFVDDNGVGKDDIELIIGDLFQRDLIREPSRTFARVSEAISELHQAGLVWRYDHEGTSLLYVAFWESIQRVDKPQPGRLPRPDGTLNYKDSQIRECVASPREDSRTLAPGTEEQGNRGTGDSLSSYVSEREDNSESENRNRMILIPDDWAPNDLHRAKYPRPDLDEIAEGFRDHAIANGRTCHGRAGWDAAFSNWVRKSKPPGGNTSTTDARIAAAQALKDPAPNVRPIRGIQA
ncbi:replication initiation protein [Gordonia phage Lucky10]|uniref:HTH DNA-binding protein n=1 Tax=Gordonia phage Lucky10 TaxID=1821557 RepID=A0A142KB23_9CAUD|nr:replication initiation protein [Gordonia phage Lucky10]AMS03306.1 HTH DNA-binding protein [Gordonia phage Lucky10]